MDQANARDLPELDQDFLLHPFTDHTRIHAVGTHIVLEGRAAISAMSFKAESSIEVTGL